MGRPDQVRGVEAAVQRRILHCCLTHTDAAAQTADKDLGAGASILQDAPKHVCSQDPDAGLHA